MKLYCRDCGKQCSNEIPEDKEESFVREWRECPLCIGCIIEIMRRRVKCQSGN